MSVSSGASSKLRYNAGMSILAAALVLAQPKQLSANDVMNRMRQAYDSFKSFEQTTSASAQGMNGTAHIYFKRPGKLAVYGTAFGNGKYILISTPHGTSVFANGSWQSFDAVNMGIATVTGISVNAATEVPMLLTHDQGLDFIFAGPKSLTMTVLNRQRLYVVSVKGKLPSTLWIDPVTFTLVKSDLNPGMHIVVNFNAPKIDNPIPDSVFVKPRTP